MKLCINCQEQEAVSGPRCKECKNALSLGVSPSNINHKWRVAIETCSEGHKYVPVNGACLICTPSMVTPKRCEYCKKRAPLGKSKYCSRKCQWESRMNQLTDKECLNCFKKLMVKQDRVCSPQCNGQYKHKKIQEVLASLPKL